MFVPVPAPPTQLTKVRTELSFTANDPWNGNRPVTFLLDDYAITLRGKSVPRGITEGSWRGAFHRALHSEADRVTRFLPDSLIELWLTKRACTESLPSLLQQIEATLRQSDYRPMLRSGAMKVFAVVETVLCAALLIIAIIAVLLADAPWWLAMLVVVGTATACGGFLYLVYFGKLFRRRRQMRWLQDRIQNAATTVLPRM